MVFNSTLVIQLTSQLDILNIEMSILKTMLTLMSNHMVMMVRRKIIITNICSILNSQDMLRFLTPTMTNTWFCISATKQLVITIKKLEIEFQHLKLGNMLQALLWILQNGQLPSIISKKILKLDQDISKMLRFYIDQHKVKKFHMKMLNFHLMRRYLMKIKKSLQTIQLQWNTGSQISMRKLKCTIW